MRHSDIWRATRQEAQLLRAELRKEQERSRRTRAAAAAAAAAVERSKLLVQASQALCLACEAPSAKRMDASSGAIAQSMERALRASERFEETVGILAAARVCLATSRR